MNLSRLLWVWLRMPSNQSLLESHKTPALKRLSVCEPAIIPPPLFSLEPLIAADDQPGNRLQQSKRFLLTLPTAKIQKEKNVTPDMLSKISITNTQVATPPPQKKNFVCCFKTTSF